MKSSGRLVIAGVHAVKAALESTRNLPVRLIMRSGTSNQRANMVADRAKSMGLEVRYISSGRFDSLTGDFPSQGIAMELSRFKYHDMDEILKNAGPYTRLLALDGITDPRNLGAVCRSAAFFKMDGIIIPAARNSPMSPAAIHVSAGGAFRLPIVRVPNLARALRALKKAGIWLAGAALKGADDLRHDFPVPPACIVLGREDKGISHLSRELCDYLVRIPGDTDAMDSLNVSASAAIFCHSLFANMKKV